MGQVQSAFTGVVNSALGAAGAYKASQIKKEMQEAQLAANQAKTENLESKTKLNQTKAATLQQKADDNTKYQEARVGAIQEKTQMMKDNNAIKTEQDQKMFDAKLENIEANTANQKSLTEKREFRNKVEKNMYIQHETMEKAIRRMEDYNKSYQDQFSQIKKGMVMLYTNQQQLKQDKDEVSEIRKKQAFSNGHRTAEYWESNYGKK